MRKKFLFITLILVIIFVGFLFYFLKGEGTKEFIAGDVIFQIPKSWKASELTEDRYVMFEVKNAPEVLYFQTEDKRSEDEVLGSVLEIYKGLYGNFQTDEEVLSNGIKVTEFIANDLYNIVFYNNSTLHNFTFTSLIKENTLIRLKKELKNVIESMRIKE